MIDIGSRRECFFDSFLIDTEKTSAKHLLHHPEIRDIVFTHDAPWEGDGCDFHNLFYDEEYGKYRLYYLAWHTNVVEPKIPAELKYIRICYAESEDGINWIKPNLRICEFNGSFDNNIILDKKVCAEFDNFYVFKDSNPACPGEERYKGIALYKKALWAFFSEDGIHFAPGRMITNKGAFDSLNTIHWNESAGVYRGYMRGFHLPGDLNGNDPMDDRPLELPDAERNERVRDVRYIESKDFKTWSHPKLIDFGDKEDIPLYTNCVSQYPRAPHTVVGFPTRYIERKAWSASFDELCGKELRLERMKTAQRFGLAVTDCIFMCSRDGVHFTRYDEAFIRPGAEHETNWVYGSCYPAVGFILTENPTSPGMDKELSMFCFENHWSGRASVIRRYAIRQDGFVSLHAGEKEETVVTKPFIFDGNRLFANMETSARGYIYFDIKASDGTELHSCEMFGDSIDKLVGFGEGLSAFSGKEVVMTIRMLDADIYSIKFEN